MRLCNSNNSLAGRIICGNCGSTFGRKVWNSTDERLRRVIWRCNRKYEKKVRKSCDNGHIDDRVLYLAFVNTFNVMIENKDNFINKLKSFKDIVYVHPLVEHSWGQKVVRFYDLDKHIIEVGENIVMVIKRFLNSGLSIEETAVQMDVPVDYIKSSLK
ncbi:recombinase zinc beta ribbon domain-containing protein [Anaerovirgula multivorans]